MLFDSSNELFVKCKRAGYRSANCIFEYKARFCVDDMSLLLKIYDQYMTAQKKRRTPLILLKYFKKAEFRAPLPIGGGPFAPRCCGP
jgi:hypothetical protein